MARTVIPIDAAMRPEGTADITKTANFNGTGLDLGAGWAPDPFKPMGLVLDVNALDLASGNETYQFDIEESSDNSTFTPTGCVFAVTATGLIQQLFKCTKRYVRAKLTVGGTTPSITYSVWFGPVSA